jgi:cell division protein FtsB
VFCLVLLGLESLSREDLLALVAMQQRQIEDLKDTVVRLADEVQELRSRLGRNSLLTELPDLFLQFR